VVTTEDPLDLDGLDDLLNELLGILHQGKPYGVVAAAVRRFVDAYTSDGPGPGRSSRSTGKAWLVIG
jgi:hypothetical protein